jgi:hypothetical protein
MFSLWFQKMLFQISIFTYVDLGLHSNKYVQMKYWNILSLVDIGIMSWTFSFSLILIHPKMINIEFMKIEPILTHSKVHKNVLVKFFNQHFCVHVPFALIHHILNPYKISQIKS